MKIGGVNSFNPKPVFGAKNVFILDGGGHGRSMEHFARAIFKNTDVKVCFQDVKVNEKLYDTKYMDSMEQTLKEIAPSLTQDDAVVIPALALASLRKLKQGLSDIFNITKNLTPQNLKSEKNLLLALVERLYHNEDKFAKQLEYLDPNAQQYGCLAGVINEINTLTQKGTNVYIPTGHPVDYTIKFMAEDRGQKPDLYRYIATGKDEEGKVKKVLDEVKNSGSYNLNLLALSDAHIVNVGDLNNKEYIFSAYDTLANDSARGVYNFYPIRNANGEVEGFSFHDRSTIEYSAKEYTWNQNLVNLLKFTGLNVRDCLADTKEHALLKSLIEQGKDPISVPDKLYRISEVYDQAKIEKERLNVLGEFINRDGDYIYDINKDGEILFQKCNCEGSERPSVVSMWGSCFAAIKAAQRDLQ